MISRNLLLLKKTPLYKRVYYWVIRILLIFGFIFTGFVLTDFVANKLERDCSVIVDFPPPDSSSFHKTVLGFGVYNDAANDWDITDEVLFQIDEQYRTILKCSETILDAEIDIKIKPAVQDPSSIGRGVFDEDDVPVERDNTLTGVIESDFKVILVSKDACIREKGVNGTYRVRNDSLTYPNPYRQTIWVNQLGSVLGHEWEHIIANVLDLTIEEEEKLYSCTSMVEHKDF